MARAWARGLEAYAGETRRPIQPMEQAEAQKMEILKPWTKLNGEGQDENQARHLQVEALLRIVRDTVRDTAAENALFADAD